MPATWPEGHHWLHHTEAAAQDPARLELLVDTHVARRRLVERCRAALDSGTLRFALSGTRRMHELYRLRDAWVGAHEAYNAALPGDVPRPEASALRAAQLESADCWYESARLMHALCRARGVRYLHFLQPTLFDEGSKPISAEERAKCVGPRGIDPRIKAGYDLLRERGRRLQEEGVEFHDTSGLFVGVEETLYFDRAHFGRRGNELLGGRIAAALLAEQ